MLNLSCSDAVCQSRNLRILLSIKTSTHNRSVSRAEVAPYNGEMKRWQIEENRTVIKHLILPFGVAEGTSPLHFCIVLFISEHSDSYVYLTPKSYWAYFCKWPHCHQDVSLISYRTLSCSPYVSKTLTTFYLWLFDIKLKWSYVNTVIFVLEAQSSLHTLQSEGLILQPFLTSSPSSCKQTSWLH